MTIKAIIFDLGNTLIEQRIDLLETLDKMELTLLPGVRKLLQEISNKYRLGLLTNTKISTNLHVRGALGKLSIADYFETVVTSFDVGVEKPDPRMFYSILLKLQVKPDESLMVGNDPLQDIQGARQVGMRTAFFHKDTDQTKIDADFHFSSFEDFPKLIKKIEMSDG